MSITKDLSTLGLAAGTHSITVKARATGFTDSPSSNAVSYTARPKLSAPTVSIANKTLSITDTSGGASSFNIYLNGSYAGFVNKATSGSTTYPLYRLALERTTYTIGISAVPPSGSSYSESVLTNKSYTYSNSGYSVTVSSYFTYIDNVTVTFHFTGGTTATYTLATLQNSYQGHTFSNVYKVTATHSATSWYCYFYSGSNYYYLEPSGGETDAAMNIEWNCTMNSETEQSCITADSLVTMVDGTQKALGEIHTGEYIRSFDWDTMTLVSNKVIYSGCEQENWDEWYCQRYFKWTFSDGTVIKNCFSHRFYNKEAKAFIYLEYWRIGDHTYKADGTNPYLVSMEAINERVRYGRISGENGTNYFANNLLTGDRHCPTNIILPPE